MDVESNIGDGKSIGNFFSSSSGTGGLDVVAVAVVVCNASVSSSIGEDAATDEVSGSPLFEENIVVS